MKRLASIAFIAIILLNSMGYYLVFVGLHFRNDRAMSRALDADVYDPSNTVTISVPVSIPYMLDQDEFSRVEGKFEHQGELYRLVKQRYANDTLTVVCVKDATHRKIDMALADYVKTFTDNAADAKQTSKTTISFIKDYLPITIAINSATEGWTLRVQQCSASRNLTPTFSASIIHPPERA